MRQLLKNNTLQSDFDQNGFLVLDVLPPSEIAALKNIVSEYDYMPDSHFHYSLIANDFDFNKRLQTSIKDVLSNFYLSHFQNFRTLNESLLIKPADTKDDLDLHQDWSIVDESIFNCLTLWIPLSDVNEQNGSLFILPCSHRWFNNIRSSSLPTPRIKSTEELLAICQPVHLKCGQILLFHPAVLHGSYPNTQQENRVVVTGNVIDERADFIHYRKASDNEVAMMQLSDETFLMDLKYMANGTLNNLTEIQRIPYSHHVPAYEEVIRLHTDQL